MQAGAGAQCVLRFAVSQGSALLHPATGGVRAGWKDDIHSSIIPSGPHRIRPARDPGARRRKRHGTAVADPPLIPPRCGRTAGRAARHPWPGPGPPAIPRRAARPRQAPATALWPALLFAALWTRAESSRPARTPVPLSAAEAAVLERLRQSRPARPQNCILFSDPNKDPDDAVSFVIGKPLQDMGLAKIHHVVTTLGPCRHPEGARAIRQGGIRCPRHARGRRIGGPRVRHRPAIGRPWCLSAARRVAMRSGRPPGAGSRAGHRRQPGSPGRQGHAGGDRRNDRRQRPAATAP